MTLDLTRPDHLDARRRVLTWELARIKDGGLRTWADFGHGKIETTAETHAKSEEILDLLRALNGEGLARGLVRQPDTQIGGRLLFRHRNGDSLLASRLVLASLAVIGVLEVLYGGSTYNDAKAIFQRIAGILLVILGLLLIAICVHFSNIIAASRFWKFLRRDDAPPSGSR
jgi:hypothetical protein